MSKTVNILIVLALAAAVAITIVAKQDEPLPQDTNSESNPSSGTGEVASDSQTPVQEPESQVTTINLNVTISDSQSLAPAPEAPKQLPRLVDVGADKCIPCKQMAPILAALKKEYAGRFEVEFIDVWKNPSAGNKYGVRIIPTQIFYDADGKELFRHVGFFSREDIMGTWKTFGVNVD